MSHENKPIIQPGQKRWSGKKDPDCDYGAATQDRSGRNKRDSKSPIISPDSRSEDLWLEPGIIHAVNTDNPLSIQAQTMLRSARLAYFPCLTGNVPGKIGGLSDSTSRRMSARAGTIKNKTLPAARWSGLLDACLERAGLREDRDLHCEAWVLVTRATDTL